MGLPRARSSLLGQEATGAALRPAGLQGASDYLRRMAGRQRAEREVPHHIQDELDRWDARHRPVPVGVVSTEPPARGSGPGGAVRLFSARIGGQLAFSGAVLRNESGPALVANRLQVDEEVFLRGGFEAVGAGDEGVVLDLTGARVGGVLALSPAPWEHRQDPHRRLRVDGLTYSDVPLGPAWHDQPGWDRLELLREAIPEYSAQPYQQRTPGRRPRRRRPPGPDRAAP